MKITDYIKDNILYLDGGIGTMLQDLGLGPGDASEQWNISHPDLIITLAKNYFDAGSNVVFTNTFSANALKYSDEELYNIIKAAVENARAGLKKSKATQEKFIALDIGPTGKLLKPFGNLDFEKAVEIFSKTVCIGKQFDIDLIMIETMNDSYETKAALLAAKENSSLPVFVSNAYGTDGKLVTGASPEVMVSLAESMGADAIGVNCSFGPEQSLEIAKRLVNCASIPVIMKPNAGMPEIEEGKTVYKLAPESFAEIMARGINNGVRIVGGCCGTTPNYIRELVKVTKGFTPVRIEKKNNTVISSYTHCVTFGKRPVLIGERINPTGKKRFRQALKDNDIDYIINEGLSQQEKGVHVLDVNVGMPQIDEASMLRKVTSELQAVSDLPLQLDSSDPLALESSMRIYNGKPLINSVNGKKEVMDAVFPLVKKYGGTLIALTLDENGIPDNAADRVKIAFKIIDEASKYGIEKKDIIFDPLTMTVSTNSQGALITLQSIREINRLTGCCTSLGVSNISFGLPSRDILNASFFLMALKDGLSAAIMNPYSKPMLDVYYSFCALNGFDSTFSQYISYADNNQPEIFLSKGKDMDLGEALFNSIFKGRKEQAAKLSSELLVQKKDPLSIINDYIIPALDKTGIEFENKRFYLPQLLMSAEAASSAFEIIKSYSGNQTAEVKCSFVIATVKGDIHDIGKNIVKLLLENYGYKVIDLGKDVDPEKIVKTVLENHSPLVGLSALMTTTLPAMEKTVAMIKTKAPWCNVIIGGAVVNQEYANSIHADKYAKDAMETVRFADKIYSSM